MTPMPNRKIWAYEWRHTVGCGGIGETSTPLTHHEFTALLFRWNVLGAGQWQYYPLRIDAITGCAIIGDGFYDEPTSRQSQPPANEEGRLFL